MVRKKNDEHLELIRLYEALRRSEERYRQLVENVNDVIFSIAADGVITYVSPVVERVLGYRPDELIGQLFSLWIHPDDLTGLIGSFERTIAGQIEPWEFRIFRKDGRVCPVRTSSRLTIENGETVGLNGVLTDLQPQQDLLRLHKRASERSDKLRETLSWMNRCATLDEALNILLLSALPLAGMDCGGIYRLGEGKIARLVSDRNLPPGFLEKVRQIELTGTLAEMILAEPSVQPDLIALPGDHQDFYRQHGIRHAYCFPLMSEGRVFGFLNVGSFQAEPPDVEDLSALSVMTAQAEALFSRLTAEQELRITLAEQKTLLAEREALLREVHHRVKNNLTVVIGLLMLQQEQFTDPSLIAAFEDCQGRVRSMALVHETLYGSPRLSEIDLSDYIGRLAREVFAAMNIRPEIRCEFDIQPLKIDLARAVPCGLIVNELIVNALKHAFPDGRRGVITIRVSADDQEFCLSVCDDGVGLSEKIQLEKSPTLGLQLVSLLTRQLAGQIEIGREQGTSFHLFFPRQSALEKPL